MRLVGRGLLSLSLMLPLLAVPLAAMSTGASWAAGGPTVPQSQLVSAVPASGTPDVVDGEVLTFAQVGSTMVAGGTFTQVQNSARTTTYPRPHIVAFDATTGVINTAFAPNLNGEVDALLAGPVAGTVYVGGLFTTDNGAAAPGLVLLNVSDGSTVTTFVPGAMTNGVLTARLLGSQLIIGGNFTSVGGAARGGLASLDATTGALTGFLSTAVTGHHNFGNVSAAELAAFRPGVPVAQGKTGVARLAINPQGTRMVVIGNFNTVGGLHRDQIAMFDISTGGAVLDPNWSTNRFSDACFWFTFDSWIRDVDFSPDGSYFAVASAGGHDFLLPEIATTCDTVTRFETAATGQDIQPTWVASSGSDSFFSVAVTGTTIYGAGHPRWMNNPLASDNKGGGSTPRPGIVALDPVNGMPLTWNPGREPRGHGTQGMLATAAGLWIGSDTDYIGNKQYLRKKIAFFPLAGGTSPASTAISALPADVYLGQSATSPANPLVFRPYDGTNTGALTPVPSPVDWSTVRGSTLIGGTLFYTRTTSPMLYSRTFDGTSFGPEVSVNPYSVPVWNNVVDAGRGSNGQLTLQGVQPDFYGQIPTVTSMAYDPSTGRMYYTLSGDGALHYRAFSPDSGVIFPVDATISGVSMAQTSGMFVSGNQLYFANGSTGVLSQVGLGGTGFTGAATDVSGPGIDGVNWAATAMFAGPLTAPVQTSPAAAFTASCTLLSCSVDGSGSTDSGATITSYAWDFGDTATGAGVTASHTFAGAGTYPISLTVTDSLSRTSTITQPVTVVATSTPLAAFSTSCSQLTCAVDASGSTDSGATITSYAWDFGDTATAAGVTASHTYSGPGTYTVGLTVTDSQSQTSTVTHQVTVSSVVHAITFVGSSQTAANAATETVAVPGGVAVGDGLVLVASSASGTVPTAPPGWTPVATAAAGSALTTTVWTRVATAGDLAGSVSVSYGALHKGSLQLLAYAGTSATTPVQLAATAVNTTSATAETTPGVSVSGSASWVLSLWEAKSSGITTWTPAAGQTLRSSAFGSSGGHLSALATDSGGPVAAGSYPGASATANASAGSATTFALVLAAA